MAFAVLLVLFAMLLATETERARHLSTRRRLCLCADRVLRLPLPENEESSFISCKEKCSTKVFAGKMSYLRVRRDSVSYDTACPPGLDYVDPKWHIQPENVKVDFYDKENGSDWYAQLSWRPFTDATQDWANYYIRYFTGKQNPIFQNYFCLTLPKNQTGVNITSSKKERRINLIVVALPNRVISGNETPNLILEAFTPPHKYAPTVFVPGTVIMTSQTTPESQNTVTTYVSISAGIIAGIILVACLLKCFWRRKKSSYLPSDFKFHAFIIYNKEDESWVQKKLLRLLEEEHSLKICIHYKDFTPGVPFVDSMAESVYASYKIIAVFSSNFIQSKYCKYELDLAKYRLLNKRDNCLIIVRIDKTDFKTLPEELQCRNCIDYADLTERRFWKRKLLKFLNVPEDPGNEGTEIEEDHDNNNIAPGSATAGTDGRTRSRFSRLDSSTSTATEISIVTLNEENSG